MRFTLLFALTLLTLLTAGCASSGPLVLDSVGPAPGQTSTAQSDGSLLVYSAFDPQAHFNGYAYRRYYTSYKIFSNDGKLVRSVLNDNGRLVEGPQKVTLPPGTYRVVARANTVGSVTVPVVIAAHQVTTVHLEGGVSAEERSDLGHADLVRLPDGEIVGWRSGVASTVGH